VIKHQVTLHGEENAYIEVFVGDWLSDKCFIRQAACCLDDITSSWRIYEVPLKTERFKPKSCEDLKTTCLALRLMGSFTEVNGTIHW